MSDFKTATPRSAALLSGRMVLVVGASGAGKDSVIRYAREVLWGDPTFLFVRRAITRPAGDPHEEHDFLAPAEFEERRRTGMFCLDWTAHGYRYAIPQLAALHVGRGGTAVANVSRTVLNDARRRIGRTMIVNVTAPPEILAYRLAGRGREDTAGVTARLGRAGVAVPDGPDVVTLINDGVLEEAGRRFVELLMSTQLAWDEIA